jgi:hypothetical protein
MDGAENAEVVIELSRMNYDRAKAPTERRAATGRIVVMTKPRLVTSTVGDRRNARAQFRQ